jgi:hypothetical protein
MMHGTMNVKIYIYICLVTLYQLIYIYIHTECPTTYQTRHLFNNFRTNEDIATRFEQEYVHCVRNEEECACSVCLFCCNIFTGFKIIKEMQGLVGIGTPYIYIYIYMLFGLPINTR